MWNKKDINYGLYLVTDRQLLDGRDLNKSIEEAVLGGVTLLQLREKNTSIRDFYHIAKQAKEVAATYNIPFIINDRLDIALAVDADGLHIGQDDLPVAIARKILGPEKILGVSAGNLAEALSAQQQGADYLGVGAVFATNTKLDADTVSLKMLQQIKSAVNIPVVAIGGINEANVQHVMASGVDGVSVISAILGKPNITEAAKNLCRLIAR